MQDYYITPFVVDYATTVGSSIILDIRRDGMPLDYLTSPYLQ